MPQLVARFGVVLDAATRILHSARAATAGLCAATVLVTACSRQPAFEEIATTEQIMETTIEPVSERVFDAAVWVNGVQVGGPQTDDDWKLVEANALMLAESSNLLLVGSRAKDRGGWVTRTQALKDAAKQAARAAQDRNTEAIFNAGTAIYQACTGCHVQYMPNLNALPSTK